MYPVNELKVISALVKLVPDIEKVLLVEFVLVQTAPKLANAVADIVLITAFPEAVVFNAMVVASVAVKVTAKTLL